MPPEQPVERADLAEPEERSAREEADVRVARVEQNVRMERAAPAARHEPDSMVERPSGLRMYRPTPAGLEPNPVELRSWRSGLRSRRWKPAALANPELSETSTGMAIAFWLVLAGVTFVALLIGYGTGIWG
jgi:hypothetical protein